LVTGACGEHLRLVPEARAELRAQDAEDAFFVVDADDDFLAAHAAAPMWIGSRTSNTVRPGTDSQVIVPPCLATIWRAMPRPRPVPSPLAFVVKNGSKTRGRTSAGTPGPSSITRTTADALSTTVSITIVPLPASACCAFDIRFVHTWFSSSTNTGTRGNTPY